MAQAAKAQVEDAAEKGVSNLSDITRRTADETGDWARHTAERVKDAAADGSRAPQRAVGAMLEVGSEVGSRSAEGVGAVSRAFAELASEQSRHAIETFQAVAQAADWREVARLQVEFMRGSLDRAIAFNGRYLEAVQAATSSALAIGADQAGKAAAR
jgi:hypothetical protein